MTTVFNGFNIVSNLSKLTDQIYTTIELVIYIGVRPSIKINQSVVRIYKSACILPDTQHIALSLYGGKLSGSKI